MKILSNPHRGTGLASDTLHDAPLPSCDVEAVRKLLALCPKAAPTPLVEAPELAARIGIKRISVKDERGRMGLGSFKALGAAYVIAHAAMKRDAADPTRALEGQTFVAASAGNHGLSVAAGARVFGAQAVIYLSQTVPESFAEQLQAKGAQVVWAGETYEESMEAAARDAETNGWNLLSDSSWPGYFEAPHRLMEGYLAMADEAFAALESPPNHILLQAGVGGLAGAVAALARHRWGDAPVIVVVEPEAAPALFASIQAGRPVVTEGPVSVMGRLDCKEPSLIALAGLSRDADFFTTISEDEVQAAMPILTGAGLATSPSGGAGIAALLAAESMADALRLTGDSHALCFLSEGAVPA